MSELRLNSCLKRRFPRSKKFPHIGEAAAANIQFVKMPQCKTPLDTRRIPILDCCVLLGPLPAKCNKSGKPAGDSLQAGNALSGIGYVPASHSLALLIASLPACDSCRQPCCACIRSASTRAALWSSQPCSRTKQTFRQP